MLAVIKKQENTVSKMQSQNKLILKVANSNPIIPVVNSQILKLKIQSDLEEKVNIPIIPQITKLKIQSNEKFVTQDEIFVTQDEISVTQDEISVTQDEISVTQDEISVTQDEISVTQDELSLIKPQILKLKIFPFYDVEKDMLMMFDGTFRSMKDLKIGDQLMGDDSKPSTIMNINKVFEQSYLVNPVKGNPYLVGESHILSLTFSSLDSKINWREERKSYVVKWFDKIGKTLTSKNFSIKKYGTKENAFYIADTFKKSIKTDNNFEISVKEYREQNKMFYNSSKSYKIGLDFPHNKFEIDPYIIGFWLGDGSAAKPEITTIDPEIIEFFTDYFKDFKLFLKQNKITHRITSGIQGAPYPGKNRFLEYLREKGLLDNKHIPLEFLLTSKENRLRLLAGLLDSDGSLDHCNCYDFIQKREHLLDQFIFLCRSLGFSCYKNDCEKTCTNSANGPVTGTYYRCCVSGEGLEEIPCILERKKASKREQVKRVNVTGITLEDVGVQATYRIVTDTPRFLLNDFTVLHRYEEK